MKKGPLALLAFTLWLAPFAEADVFYTFSMNTMPLVGHGPFMLDLQFLDGSGSSDMNNTVKLTNFAFGTGGSPSGGGTANGGATGSLASGVTLNDSAFFNEYYENFTPGNLLSFSIDTTNNADLGLTPDLFTVAILDSMGYELPTTGPASEFLDLSLTGGANPLVFTFGSAPGSTFSLAAPTVLSQNPSPVPEPSYYSELLIVILAFGIARNIAKSSSSAKPQIR